MYVKAEVMRCGGIVPVIPDNEFGRIKGDRQNKLTNVRRELR